MATRAAAVDAWRNIARALAASGDESDRDLAQSVSTYVDEMLVLVGANRAKELEVPSEEVRLAEPGTRGSFHER